MDASTTILLSQHPVVRHSIVSDCQREKDKFKWLLSEKAGFDLGEQAIHQWVRDHWWHYLRARWIEHLHGTYFWAELDRDDFGLIRRDFQDCKPLLEQILDRLKDGEENLDIISWAVHCLPDSVDLVIRILEVLDLNSIRLEHQFYCGKSAAAMS